MHFLQSVLFMKRFESFACDFVTSAPQVSQISPSPAAGGFAPAGPGSGCFGVPAIGFDTGDGSGCFGAGGAAASMV